MVLISLKILIPIAILILLLIVILWKFHSKNKIFAQKITSENMKKRFYQEHIQKLQNSRQEPIKDFNHLNKIVRSYFNEYYNLTYNLTYLELSKIFQKQNKLYHANFCNLMNNLRYSGNKITPNNIKQLVEIFKKITSENN